jgi:hypothetical protein
MRKRQRKLRSKYIHFIYEDGYFTVSGNSKQRRKIIRMLRNYTKSHFSPSLKPHPSIVIVDDIFAYDPSHNVDSYGNLLIF